MRPYYEADGITIYHGDCRAIDVWTVADVLVTDPPYGRGACSQRRALRLANDGDLTLRDALLTAWGGKPALVFGDSLQPHPQGTRMVLIWDKGMWGMGDLSLPWGFATEEIYVLGHGFIGGRGGNILRHPRIIDAEHPTPKPVSLLETLLGKCPSGMVADPCMGTGSTLVAAQNLGRQAIGVEIDERYCEIAAERLAQRVLAFG